MPILSPLLCFSYSPELHFGGTLDWKMCLMLLLFLFCLLVCFVHMVPENQGTQSLANVRQELLSFIPFLITCRLPMLESNKNIPTSAVKQNTLQPSVLFSFVSFIRLFYSKTSKQLESYSECILYNFGVYKTIFIAANGWIYAYVAWELNISALMFGTSSVFLPL